MTVKFENEIPNKYIYKLDENYFTVLKYFKNSQMVKEFYSYDKIAFTKNYFYYKNKTDNKFYKKNITWKEKKATAIEDLNEFFQTENFLIFKYSSKITVIKNNDDENDTEIDLEEGKVSLNDIKINKIIEFGNYFISENIKINKNLEEKKEKLSTKKYANLIVSIDRKNIIVKDSDSEFRYYDNEFIEIKDINTHIKELNIIEFNKYFFFIKENNDDYKILAFNLDSDPKDIKKEILESDDSSTKGKFITYGDYLIYKNKYYLISEKKDDINIINSTIKSYSLINSKYLEIETNNGYKLYDLSIANTFENIKINYNQKNEYNKYENNIYKPGLYNFFYKNKIENNKLEISLWDDKLNGGNKLELGGMKDIKLNNFDLLAFITKTTKEENNKNIYTYNFKILNFFDKEYIYNYETSMELGSGLIYFEDYIYTNKSIFYKNYPFIISAKNVTYDKEFNINIDKNTLLLDLNKKVNELSLLEYTNDNLKFNLKKKVEEKEKLNFEYNDLKTKYTDLDIKYNLNDTELSKLKINNENLTKKFEDYKTENIDKLDKLNIELDNKKLGFNIILILLIVFGILFLFSLAFIIFLLRKNKSINQEFDEQLLE